MVLPAAWMTVALLVVIGAGIHTTQAARDEGGSNDGKKTVGPKSQLPDDKLFQDPAAFCEGCYGLVHGKWIH